MFGFICRSIGCSVRVRKLYFLENPSLLVSSLRHISSSNINANQHSFTVSYLRNNCGFSLNSALELSKHVLFQTPHKPDSVSGFFKNHGFSKDQILKLVRKCPQMLLCNPDKTLFPKLDFFYSKGVSSPDLAKIISSYPWILRSSLENQLVPNFNFFENLLQSTDITIQVFKRYPGILEFHLVILGSILNILRDNGVSEKDIVMLVRFRPSCMIMGLERFKKLVEEVRAMGIDPSKTQFVLAIMVTNSMSRTTWERKVDAYKMWNLPEEDIFQAFKKFPWFMTPSEDKITAVMDLYVNKLGWESSFIAKNPFLIAYSLEKRLIPRASVLQFLVSKGLVEKSFRKASFFNLTENKFLQTYVNHHAESKWLLELYKEKLNLSR